jgi:prepilin-type N-terminal cleavage/methylation domain-containing protein
MNERGVTLIEMLVVVAILGIMTTIAYPSITAGLDSLRLSAACDEVAGIFHASQNFAERRQRTVELRVQPSGIEATAKGFERRVALGGGLAIAGEPRSVFVEPAAPLPGVAVEIRTAKGAARRVKIDPISGVAEIE